MSATWFSENEMRIFKNIDHSLERIADALDRLAPTDFADCSCQWVFPNNAPAFKSKDGKCVIHGYRAERIEQALEQVKAMHDPV